MPGVMSKSSLPAHEVRRVAVTAFADLRSVEKYLRGGDLRPMAKLRIELALKELGHGEFVREPEQQGGARVAR
jgi:hypothetical protein